LFGEYVANRPESLATAKILKISGKEIPEGFFCKDIPNRDLRGCESTKVQRAPKRQVQVLKKNFFRHNNKSQRVRGMWTVPSICFHVMNLHLCLHS
jgi:hypothetical protein